ncbi:hypothetical protein OROGR_029388 [Orobanche gracilis]
MEGPDSSRTYSIEEPSGTLLHSRRRRCCFFPPCFDRSASSSASAPAGLMWWQKIRTAEIEGRNSSSSLWARGIGALKRIREWSEIVAGPRWKTFVRRFNRNRIGGGGRHLNVQYDPLSYAMNFDEGPGRSGHFGEDGEDGYYYGSRNFSSRYAKGSMDLGRDGPGPT